MWAAAEDNERQRAGGGLAQPQDTVRDILMHPAWFAAWARNWLNEELTPATLSRQWLPSVLIRGPWLPSVLQLQLVVQAEVQRPLRRGQLHELRFRGARARGRPYRGGVEILEVVGVALPARETECETTTGARTTGRQQNSKATTDQYLLENMSPLATSCRCAWCATRIPILM